MELEKDNEIEMKIETEIKREVVMEIKRKYNIRRNKINIET